MADNIIVIGRGKLIADTSIKKLIAGSSQSGVFVRTSKLGVLETALEQQSVSFEKLDGGLKVEGKTTDEIGHIAFKAGLPVLELASRSATLEDAFLELTADSEEYSTNKRGGT